MHPRFKLFFTRLSELRAGAAREYLVVNKTIEAGQIAAVSSGFSGSLVSNRTDEARAQDRRIDVTIDASPIVDRRHFHAVSAAALSVSP